jgi:hypothetical protein
MPTPAPNGLGWTASLKPSSAAGPPFTLERARLSAACPKLAHRPHDAHVRDVQIALGDFELRVPEQYLALADI